MTTVYGTTVDGIAYWAERGKTVTLTNADLIVASEWIDNHFTSQFPGLKTGERAQEREWPRKGAYDHYGYDIGDTVIPPEVERATYEIAYRNNVSPGSLNVDATMGTNIVKAAVSGAVSVEYAGAADINDLQLTIPIVGKILSPILTGDGDFSSLSAGSVRV